MSSAEAAISSPALEETMSILRPPTAVPHGNGDGGYIDVLGQSDPIEPNLSHQFFRSKVLPPIYERLWRPVVSRAFVGLFGMGPKKERRTTLEMLSISPGDRVIDVGCGPGNYTRYLAQASGNGLVVGVDASETMIAAGAKRGGAPNLAYMRADACALPFGDGEFDAVCCVGAVHMFHEPMSALAEMVRMLGPGGRIAIVASCAPEGAPKRIQNGVIVFARDELTGALEEHGMTEIRQRVVRRGQFVSARKPVA